MNEKVLISKREIVWRQFKKHKLGVIGAIMLIILYMGAIFAPFIAPYSFMKQNRRKTFHPPTKIHFIDEKGHFSLRPFVYSYKMANPVYKKYKEVKTRKYYIRFFVKGSKYKLFGLIPSNIHLFGVDRGGYIFLFGICLSFSLVTRFISVPITASLPAGNFSTYLIIFDVDPHSSASSTTSSVHSGCTMIFALGYRAFAS